ncbi:unnamed protein product [Adineta ricciae]|uniref:Uncharacterized protein n=1 Tax=Adineta ricciae TaxID=249248 RepID=A0A814V6L7_ADIRI|nr:unnamed protein product [Adineta ricciae]CAF1182702.1 unnamed protein product [Adineta ricciae]
MNLIEHYQYIDEECIDPELICSLCMSPFQIPTSGKCDHTFCKLCIEQWIDRQPTCPICRIRLYRTGLQQISTRIVLNQLHRLQMRCKRCDRTNIQRGNINQHEEQCPQQIVPCPASDIKCTWKGARSTLANHLRECPFQKIRPVIADVYQSLKNVYEPLINELQTLRQQLEQEKQRNHAHTQFLVALFNKGKPMSDRCTCSVGECRIQQNAARIFGSHSSAELPYQNEHKLRQNKKVSLCGEALKKQHRILSCSFGQYSQTSSPFTCANCQKGTDFSNIALHHCEGGCICRACVQKFGSFNPFLH